MEYLSVLRVLGLLIAAPGFVNADSLDRPREGLTPIETVCVDNAVTRRAVANPTNQKVVSNDNGIFLTYLCTSTKQDQRNRWRLMRSTDGGKTFKVLYEEVSATKAPTLETDERNNLYLCRPDFSTRGKDPQGWFYRFSASDKYARPLKVPVPRGMAGKFAAAWDPSRQQMYYWVHSGWFIVLGPDGRRRNTERIVVHGPVAYLQYPLLCMARDGSLYAGWTTWERSEPEGRRRSYWDIHAMRSPDGGKNWQKLDGTRLERTPVADNSGPTERVTLDDEFETHTWLASLLAKDGKLHFVYKARAFEKVAGESGAPPRQHYVRYDQSSGKKELDHYPEFRGEKLVIRGSHCLLSASLSIRNSPLYCVGYEAPWMNRCRLVCLASDDNGETWYDYAVSDKDFMPTGVGGFRQLTDDGLVVGTFTDLVDVDDVDDLDMFDARHRIYFLKIQAGLAKADVASRTQHETKRIRFTKVRGQPQWIRFRRKMGRWGNWTRFQTEMTLPDARATLFQLKSRMGVVSGEHVLPRANEKLKAWMKSIGDEGLKTEAERAARRKSRTAE